MAYIVARGAAAGYRAKDSHISELFFPAIYGAFTLPMVRLMRVLGLERIWKTS